MFYYSYNIYLVVPWSKRCQRRLLYRLRNKRDVYSELDSLPDKDSSLWTQVTQCLQTCRVSKCNAEDCSMVIIVVIIIFDPSLWPTTTG